ncbi:MAG TPA: hypothetical protein VG204_09505 [Terriglobia bacterium]|nr:hypothetical protein [Terriglobia bacterium]
MEWKSQNPGLPFTVILGDQECPCYLTSLDNGVRYVLCNMGTVYAASLRRIAKLSFWRTKDSFVADETGLRVPTDETMKAYVRHLDVMKAELYEARARFAGVKRAGRRVNASARKTPAGRGRPRDRHINTALRLLREGIRRHKHEYPKSRERWLAVFRNEVCPHFETNVWPTTIVGWTGTGKEKKAAVKRLRNALYGRGGVGICPPEKKSKVI